MAVPLRTVLRTTRSCHGDEREEMVLRSPEEWQRWRDHASCGAGPAEPVDFATEIVLAVGDEAGPNACHSVEIARAIGGPDGLVVDIVRHTGAVAATRAAARDEADKASRNLHGLPPSVYRDALVDSCARSVERSF